MQLLHQSVGDLRGQALLHLRPLRKGVHKARELRQPADAPVGRRDVRHMRHAEERHEMVLAHGVERDVAHEHHLLVMLVKRRLEVLGGVFHKAREHLLVHLRHALWRLEQPFPIRVLAHALQDEAHARFDLRSVHDRPSIATQRPASYHAACGCVQATYQGPPSKLPEECVTPTQSLTPIHLIYGRQPP